MKFVEITVNYTIVVPRGMEAEGVGYLKEVVFASPANVEYMLIKKTSR